MKIKRFLIFFFKCAVAFIAFIVLFVFVANLFIHAGAAMYTYENMEDVKEAQTALILGAAILKDGTLSPIFESRVDKAIELYKEKKVSKILASGDNSTVEHNEVNPVRTYLLGKGIPDEDIFLDHAGFDTYSTMYRARDIFKVSSVIIVSQSFHLPRAVFIARMLRINARGISADGGPAPIKNYVREVFANEKAVLNLVLDRKPKYLGDAIPITADGRDYP